MACAGILWLGWNGFNGGDPYFANANAGGAVLNPNLETATALVVWVLMDRMITGLVGTTPGAGYVNGVGAIIVGVCVGIIPWLSFDIFAKTRPP